MTQPMRGPLTAIAVAACTFAGAAMADESADLVVNGDLDMVIRAPAPAHMADAVDEVLSGWIFRSDETQELQMDDFDNPGMIFVDQAMDQWSTVEGTEGKSCASCHDDVEDSIAACHHAGGSRIERLAD